MEQKNLVSRMENKVYETSLASEESCASSSAKNFQVSDRTICDTKSEVNGSSAAQVKKDFKETPKYSDTESYSSQHHHSIGTGLFLTDEIKDLPPRFRDKVIRALETGAALNNIPLDRLPLHFISSDCAASDSEEKNFDSLIAHSPISLENVNKSSKCEKNPKVLDRQDSNARKNYNSFQHLDSKISSNSKEQDKVSACGNSKSTRPFSSDFIKGRPNFKSEYHCSNHVKDCDRKSVNHQEKDFPISNVSNTSHFVPISNSSQLGTHPKTSQPYSKHKYSSNSISQRNSVETVKSNTRTESEYQRIKPSSSVHNKIQPDRTFNNCQFVSNSSSSEKSQFSKSKNFSQKQHNGHSNKNNKNFEDKSFSHKESFNTRSENPSPAKDETGISTNFSGKRTAYRNEQPPSRSRTASSSSCSSSVSYHKDTSKDKIVGNNKALLCDVYNDKTGISNNFSRKRFTHHNEQPHSRSRTASSSSHSSSVSYCKDIYNDKIVDSNKDFPCGVHKNLGISRDSINTDYSSVDSSFSHKKSAYRHHEKNIEHYSKMPKDPRHKSSFKNSSNQISDASVRRQDSFDCASSHEKLSHREGNSTTLVHKHSNDNFHDRSYGRYDEKFNRSNKFLQNPSLPKKPNHEISKCDFDLDSPPKVPYNGDETRNYSLQQSNYNKKNKFSSKPTNTFEKNTDSNQNFKSGSLEECSKFINNNRGCIENGFFVKMEVSEEARNLEYWVGFLRTIFSFQFELERCCHFSDILILEFDRKEQALQALRILRYQKKKLRNSKMPYIITISTLIVHLTKPCSCKRKVIYDSRTAIEKHAETSLSVVNEKIEEIKSFKPEMERHNYYEHDFVAKREMLKAFKDSKSNFLEVKKNILMKVKDAENLKTIQQLKFSFIRECNSFKRCLPIYSKKEEIMHSVRFYSVSVIIAETGSGKSTQLVEYFLHSDTSNYGLIICTQPRKLAAISIAQFVSGQIGSAVGKIIGYEVGMERKCSELTKIMYMTDYCLLKKYLRNPTLKDVSCVIIDEAHERSLYTDLLLGVLKKCIESRPDLRVIVTSATINPTIFVDYFKMSPESVIEVPGRSYPVDVIWYPEDVDKGWNYVNACVRKVYQIYTRQPEGDILVFLTSSSESEEAINLFKKLLSSKDEKPRLLSLHGKSDIQEQMQVFQAMPQTSRKIVFATNVAETSVTIPGIKYVVDSGMTKDLKFDPKMNKSYLEVTFINKSAAEQRKGRAGRTQSGVCYRMYSERNYTENMPDNAVPEVLKLNLQKALLKIFELGINPSNFNFIETPPERTISNSIDSLEYLGAVKNSKLTELGRKIAKLPVEPQLAKLILQGLDAGIGYEIIIIAALVTESGKLFIRSEENKVLADEKKKQFCQEGGDLCTYLEIYKRWKEVHFSDRFRWCINSYVSSKALKSAAKTVYEIIFSLRTDLGLQISTKYNNIAFKKQYEKILFDCFSENLCVSSGHPKSGYLSPYLPESFFIHPSSTLSYLGKDSPEFLVYRTLMETSRNFLFDITPISEETIKLAIQSGSFKLPLHSLRSMQVPPKIMGPFGESVLIRYVIGKQGSKIKDLEARIQQLTKVKNIYVDVAVEKGLITFYLAQRFHEKVSKDITQIIEQAHNKMLKEEDVIKLWGTSMHFALGAGGLINDIIMPGEFRELIFSQRRKGPKEESHLENILETYGPLQSVCYSNCKQETQICVTYKKVCDAQKAFSDLKNKKLCSVSSKPYLPNVSDKSLPLYMLNASWCCRPCTGYGSVEFFSEEDLIVASGILTRKSFTVDNNLLMFSPSQDSSKELSIKNLPQTVDEQAIRSKLRQCLPQDINLKKISIFRKHRSVINLVTAKQKLQQVLSSYVPTTKFVIDIKDPNNEAFWKASVYFDCLKDAEQAFVKLKDNTKIDSYPLFVKQVFKSSLHCKHTVYNALSKQILHILEDKKTKGLCDEFSIKQLDTEYDLVEFTCINFQELNRTRQNLQYFLLGESIDLVGTSKYDFLFSNCHMEHIKQIQRSTNTWIGIYEFRKIITIYGSFDNCQRAKEKIYLLASNSDFSFTRTFNLKDSCIPAGFLKELYTKYGYDLHGLVNEFKLTVASVDNFGQALTLKGLKKGIKMAEQGLEEMCEKLLKSKGERLKTSSQQEICPICFDPVSYAFQRLEHCGHAFCHQCLLLQVESKTMPMVCVKENCGKLIFLEDIKRIISCGNHLKKTFCTVALQHHVSSNVGKISYCPTPDCQMVYRVTEQESEFNCPACKNSTCSHCQAPFHYGMSCEMFQNCLADEDYSLKSWVKKDESARKYCPSCKAVIEKESGCNHMECLNCKVHLCWLCLQIFPTGPKVYDHIPFCTKNQSN